MGTYTSLADIEAIQNPTNNDYAFLETADGAGNNVYDRYKYSAEDGEWLFEYELNNSSFTAEQWATINSGITQVSDTVQDGDTNPVSSDAVYEALQSAGGGGGAQCSTAGNVQAKVATMDGFVLNTGVTFPISFANSNSYDGKITLNVNSTGAKDVYINNAVSSSTNKTLNAGSYICRYNGTNYYIDTSYAVTNARNASYATSATTARNARNTIAICSTASAIVAKTATLDGYALTSGDRIPLYMTNNNTANSATLNVNSTGSKRIRINGSTVVNETYKNLPAGFYMAHYDGTYWNLYNLVNMSTEASFNGSSFAITLNRAYGALGVVTWYMSPDVNFIVFVNGLKIQWGHRTDKTTNGYTLTLPLSYTSESSFACFASANDGRYGYESLENKIVSASSFTVNRQAYTCTNWSYFCIGY